MRLDGLRRNGGTPNETEKRPSRLLIENSETSLLMFCSAKVSSLTERINSYPKGRPVNPLLPKDLDEAQRVEREVSDLVSECEDKLHLCDDAAKSAEEEVQALRIDEAGRTARLEIAHSSKQDAASQLTSDREGEADEVLAAAVAAANEKEASDRRALDEGKVQLSNADPESVEALLENARQATKRARQELQENRDSQNKLSSSLDIRGEQGLQTALDEASNKLNYFEREHERQEARAEAARLLRDTFAKHRQQARQRYIQPFKECIDQLGRIVFGSTFEVELDEDLQIVRRTLDGITLDISQLSTGARGAARRSFPASLRNHRQPHGRWRSRDDRRLTWLERPQTSPGYGRRHSGSW